MRRALAVIFVLSLFFVCDFLVDGLFMPASVGMRKPFADGDSLVTIVFAGDMMGHEGQYKSAWNDSTGRYEYDPCFMFVRDYVSRADLACVNLEVPIAGKPYSTYPQFCSPDELLDGLKNAGFDVVFTANNHTVDKGKRGLERTLEQLEKRNFSFAGSYKDTVQRDSIYPLMVNVRGWRVAFLNCTYGTNGLPVTPPNVVNMIDTNDMRNALLKSEEQHADVKIVCIHWGNEYELHSCAAQRVVAQWLADNGADLIIGGHPHVVQEADTLYRSDGTPVVCYYSIGNYISNQRKPHTNGGIMVRATFNRFSGKVIATSYLPSFVHRGTLDGKYQYYLVPTPQYFKNPSRFQLNRQDSTDLVFFHNSTLKRLYNFAVEE